MHSLPRIPAVVLGLLILGLLIGPAGCGSGAARPQVTGSTGAPERTNIPEVSAPSICTPAADVTRTATPNSSTSVPDVLAAPNKLGVHLLLDDGRNQWPVERWPEHMRSAREAVGEWGYITELVRLDDLDAERWQVFMDLSAQQRLQPILRLATTFDTKAQWWRAPEIGSDGGYALVADQYAEFVASLRWPTSRHYVIVGNEPNRGDEWGGRPDASAYARFLIDVADAIRRRDPHAVILNGGLDPFAPNSGSSPAFDGEFYLDAESFLDQMQASHPDVFRSIDIWASHSYPLGPFTAGPWEQSFVIDLLNGSSLSPGHLEPPGGIYNRGVNGYEWEILKLESYGVRSLPVMITESGWRHAESTAPDATDTGERLPDAVTIAAFLDLALHGNDGRYPSLPEHGWRPWLEDARVVGVTPFALNGNPSEWGHTNWLALDEDGAIVGTYAPYDLLTARSVPGSFPQD